MMEFGIGFVTGGVLAGFAVAKSGGMVKTAHQWLANAEAYVKQKVAARAAAFKSKL